MLKNGVLKIFNENNIRIAGKYSGQKEIVEKYERDC